MPSIFIHSDDRIRHAHDRRSLRDDAHDGVTKTFEDTSTYLKEWTVRQGSPHAGRPIREFSGDGLILLVRRGEEEIIPHGSTVLHEGDRLVLLIAR